MKFLKRKVLILGLVTALSVSLTAVAAAHSTTTTITFDDVLLVSILT